MKRVESEISRLERVLHDKTGQFITMGTVESATGGKIADRLTDVAGSSDYFVGAIVSYSNAVKHQMAYVRESTLAEHGAVSAETAREMAEGGRKVFKVDICVSTTGIAGPSGATGTKPVGLFFIALASDGSTSVEKQVFKGKREENKRKATLKALCMLKQHLLGRLGTSPARNLEERQVVTCFLEQQKKVLLLKRSGKVGTYRRDWAGVSGYIETDPLDQAYTEIREETGLFKINIRLVRQGKPVEVIDNALNRRWVVHPFLFHVLDPQKIMIDWEHTEFKWIKPSELKDFNTVPGLDRALRSAMGRR